MHTSLSLGSFKNAQWVTYTKSVWDGACQEESWMKISGGETKPVWIQPTACVWKNYGATFHSLPYIEHVI